MKFNSTLQVLAQTVLNEDPIKWIASKRDQGSSWQQIADELGDQLGVTISRETIRLWMTTKAAS